MQDCGVRKLTVVDSGRVVVSNLARQSLYTSDDRGAPKATAILKHLVERCPSVVSLHFLPIETVLPPFFFLLLSCLNEYLPCALAGCTRHSDGNTYARASCVSW